MKIFKKNIESRQGIISANQVVSGLKINLYSDGVNPNILYPQSAEIEITLYKDKTAIIAGKSQLETIFFTINDIKTLQTYPTVVTELIGLMTMDPNSPVFGATIEDTKIV